MSSTCRGLQSLVAGLPEAAWLAAAQRSLPPTHPACLSSDVRAALTRQRRLVASLADPASWRMEDKGRLEGAIRALSPDFSLLAFGCEHALTVLDVGTRATVAKLELATRSCIHDLAFSCDSRTLAATFSENSRLWVLLLSVASGEEMRRRLTDVDVSDFCRLVWAPSACNLFLQVPAQNTCSWLLLSASGAVLAELAPPFTDAEATWCPTSQLMASIDYPQRHLHCLDWQSTTWHSHPITGAGFIQVIWVPRPAQLPQLLILSVACALQLLAAPGLTVLGLHQLPSRPMHCSCSQKFVAICDHKSLHLFHLQCEPAAGQPFLLALCTLLQTAECPQPAFSPAGTCIARMLPGSDSSPPNLELLSLAADQFGEATRGAATCGVLLLLHEPLWSADGCSIALRGCPYDDLHVMQLLGE